ncbi:putative transmembrane anti-sigma factor [Chthoniobacter flavus Ellin428]|uniref:Putative transmembrane anti-sigma factor n=1 Tax=Chthoniobacter flavus Ellin428 TaxID=497964 RepID=B4CW58_9BACT|nr:hypothetical protein [Chthoniobacter flavus]EDY21650.1 putative transmembrane anti-sigma factor [Chthoniobacter flavus Ellin428]TCO95588.1 hypothetical protein EV701_101275 [Chthoniobacter flavus]
MKPFEEQFTAWVDGKLTDAELAEFEKQLAEHPDAAADRDDALKLGRLLRAHPPVLEMPNPDFFNHQLLQRIEAETPKPRVVEKKQWSFWSIPGLAWAGASCLIVAGALFATMIPGGPKHLETSTYFAQVVENWSTDPNVTASTVYDPKDQMTVVWLDGLDYIPATYALNK